MPYEILGHTADIRLWAEGKDLKELFTESLLGMMGILDPEEAKGIKESRRRIAVSSVDKTALLIDFLNEALFNSEKYREFYVAADFRVLSDTRLEAELIAKPAASFSEDIKAVTYHEASIIKNPKGFLETKIVFDI